MNSIIEAQITFNDCHVKYLKEKFTIYPEAIISGLTYTERIQKEIDRIYDEWELTYILSEITLNRQETRSGLESEFLMTAHGRLKTNLNYI